METDRLLIRKMKGSDESVFTDGTADRTLRLEYGLPEEMDTADRLKLFRRFCGLEGAYSICEKKEDRMIGFLVETDPELPAEIAESLGGTGRTLAFAVFPPYQRQGYMEETLKTYVGYLFRNRGMSYIHCGHFPDNMPSTKLLQKAGFPEYARHTFNGRIIIDRIKKNDESQY